VTPLMVKYRRSERTAAFKQEQMHMRAAFAYPLAHVSSSSLTMVRVRLGRRPVDGMRIASWGVPRPSHAVRLWAALASLTKGIAAEIEAFLISAHKRRISGCKSKGNT
jgi:hypothetical protein